MYIPNQRTIDCQIQTDAGWLNGTFHVMQQAKFVDQLNGNHDFLKLTDCKFAGRENTIPFLNIRRSSVSIIVPDPTSAMASNLASAPAMGNAERVEIHCILENAIITGTIMMHKGLRVSDYFARNSGFLLLRSCSLKLGDLRQDFFVEEEHRFAIVNGERIIGVSESSPLAD